MKARRLLSLLLAVLMLGSCGNSSVGRRNDSKKSARSRGGGGWQDLVTDVAGGIFLGAEKGVIFYAYDVLAYPNQAVDLLAKVQWARILDDIPDVTVGFYRGSKFIGSARTDDYGRATLSWTPQEPGNYALTAKITAVPDKNYKDLLEVSPAPLLIAVHQKDSPFVVIDLDHTVVASSFFRVLVGGAKPMPDSVKVTKSIAKKYGIIYLTQRPVLLTRKSKGWLKDRGYPSGPLLLSELSEALAGSGTFKSNLLARARESFPGIKIGIGDKPSDAQAYVDNGMTAYLLAHYKNKAKDIRKMAKKIGELQGRGRLQVVKSWKQIQEGILKGKQFPPDHFVSYLQRRADELQQQEEKRKEEDYDEDNDD